MACHIRLVHDSIVAVCLFVFQLFPCQEDIVALFSSRVVLYGSHPNFLVSELSSCFIGLIVFSPFHLGNV